MQVSDEEEQRPPSFLQRWFSWRPTSRAQLIDAEKQIMRCVDTPYKSRYVQIAEGKRIWTVTLREGANDKQLPLVMVHGFCSGLALWVQNFDALCKKRTVHAFDLLGFGRSSRPPFSTDAMAAEEQFVDSIEQWRSKMNLDKVILLGHSLGAFLSCAYALRYPQHIEHLILCDPWGFPERTPPSEQSLRLPIWIRALATVLTPFNPLVALRVAGPWGPGLVQRFRPDLQRKYADILEDESVFNYIYHINAQTPSGETAFKHMTIPYGWAKYPMLTRIEKIDQNLPITMVFGSRSWIDSSIGFKTRFIRHESKVNIRMINGVGHHLYADRPADFNAIIQEVCDGIDGESEE